ncbi:hypothetical protein [Qipengyuania gelatinilytica]|uniref:Viral coat protein P2 N-terminal domain-containing protein n=1 Tax=Qipengyuania gelatinilytica TaxID=2867231 RepID=A0ABX9A7T3_9SPHN|nr:hypothetical protein [Qipengyuania gelatinilytica]QZD96329.1 hypothetical protein K3136_06510 [Qipengyuania gelatinilytica]
MAATGAMSTQSDLLLPVDAEPGVLEVRKGDFVLDGILVAPDHVTLDETHTLQIGAYETTLEAGVPLNGTILDGALAEELGTSRTFYCEDWKTATKELRKAFGSALFSTPGGSIRLCLNDRDDDGTFDFAVLNPNPLRSPYITAITPIPFSQREYAAGDRARDVRVKIDKIGSKIVKFDTRIIHREKSEEGYTIEEWYFSFGKGDPDDEKYISRHFQVRGPFPQTVEFLGSEILVHSVDRKQKTARIEILSGFEPQMVRPGMGS